MPEIVSIGECMVELSRQPDGSFQLACGGDTFNTAAYAARLGVETGYAMALGDDPYSAAILALGAREGVDMSAIPRLSGRVPGLYVIETDGKGERTFTYWRDSAPARELFERPEAERVVAAMAAARIVYFSGITLSLYSPAGLDRFETALRAAKANGARIAFDGNYRPRGWKQDAARARATFERFLPLVDIALPTFDDEQALFGDSEPAATLARIKAFGPSQIIVKSGAAGALLAVGDEVTQVPVPEVVTPVDTTAAGDSFNAGYLSAVLRGKTPTEAALWGHRLAAIVIRHRGAIVPREATEGLRV
jgi:2-dehydro-3-deoxygluconokinase